jgi:acyl-CoA reductase-like NAD-dependent aldehyde dehydrogenase
VKRLPVEKTLKMYLGGKFVRSESGQTLPSAGADGRSVNVCRASRKDLRNAVTANRKAQAGWAGRTAYNRGQILYRLAEILDDRKGALPTTAADAEAATDRAIHHAGWSDKVTALLSSLNPVGQAYVNYSLIRPLGVVVACPDPADALLGMVEALCTATVMGNAVTLLVPIDQGPLATALAEALAVSDVPGGVVNVLTAIVPELVPVVSSHDDVDGLVLWGAALDAESAMAAERDAAHMMRRIVTLDGASRAAGPPELARLAEVQTVWMSTGAAITRSGGY